MKHKKSSDAGRTDESQAHSEVIDESIETDASDDLDVDAEDDTGAKTAFGGADHSRRGSDAPAVDAEEIVDNAEPEDKAQEYFEQMLRLKAEFDNYRRRVSKERQEWARSARASVLSELLGVLDDAKRARRHAEDSEQIDAEGVMLILKRLEERLAQLGVQEMDTQPGAEFDPEMHEALMTTPSEEIPEGHIVMTLEPGYVFEEQMLRPGKVSVSSGEPG